MGILFEQPSRDQFGGTSALMIRAVWDGQGSSKYTISEIAHEICGTPEKVFKDLYYYIQINDPIIKSLWKHEAKPLLAKLNQELETEEDDGFDGQIKHPNDGHEEKLHVKGVEFAKTWSGNKYLDWKIDLDPNVHPKGFMLGTDLYRGYRWIECRAMHSAMEADEEEVEEYKDAIRKLKPHLERLEKILSEYDEAVKRWCKKGSDGEVYLKGLAHLNLVERILDIYSDQDNEVKGVNAVAKELTHYAVRSYQDELLKLTRPVVKKLVTFYFDKQANEALRDYLGVWDPVRAYYYHKYAAISVNVPDCDKRLFSALRRMSQYLPSDDQTAEEVGLEAEYCFRRLMELEEEEIEDKNLKYGAIRAQKDKKSKQTHLEDVFRELHKSQSCKTGILSTLASWSGAIGKWVGSIEGPPTIMSILLNEFSKTDAFINVLRKDTLVRAVVTIGLPHDLISGIADKIKKGGPLVHDLERLREVYKTYSWRSPAVLHVFMFLGVATLLYDVGLLIEEVEQGKTEKDPSDEIVRLMTKLAHDTLSLGLTWVTLKVGRRMRAALTENINARAGDLYSRITGSMPSWRGSAVRALHGGMAFLGTVLSVWDLADQWDETDIWQKTILAVNVGSGLAGLVGAVFSISWLGPISVVVGLLAGAALSLYSAFQTGIEKTLLGLLKGFEKSKLYNKLSEEVVKTKDYFFYEEEIHFSEVCDDLKSQIANYDWEDDLDTDQAIRYQRAGMPLEALVKLYETEMREMKSWLREQRYQERWRRERNLDFKVRLESPGLDAKLILGAASQFSVKVIDHTLVPFVWLEMPYNDLEWYFSTSGTNTPGGDLNSFDAEKGAILFKRKSYSKHVQHFTGTVFLMHMPPGDGVVLFELFVPRGEDKRSVRWEGQRAPEAHYGKELKLEVGIRTPKGR